ncbi:MULTISPECIES: type II toxin-antitoxin system RelE/ParE family toxin [unclassified Oceanispirochaeta]|uniref:type II toxin-antitoxin system RelE/ParE family toxin n=1 Tax=unclassified Oceanispirochaeta TaxID=2635722 RepID=UPI000E09CF47|nr:MULTISPECIES: type II toxin-antitoxin system RelE/ParE family toxin [unclassified Oceanispirochaeta]MBF9017009.1 type II toxin-antitoxin system RelE/ParE family toxin [Oceanispirochaeta sp. M2]NPD73458.1 type II toxin-antitoxin system RelE/ParE family toxin [Oceanispirochaeta sp. M1]RDG30751.1 type II toxin-antitoxin system RelE/ParE family toxin [Oceanispirochaeta sp. M1]
MIKSFHDDQTESVWNRTRVKGFPSDIFKVARRKLGFLEDAVDINDLRVPPGNRLEALKGNREGPHSIRINAQWRVCFQWVDGNAFDVEIADYH